MESNRKKLGLVPRLLIAILLGILATWIIGMLCQVAGIYVPDNVSYFSLFPTWGLTDFSKLGETFGQCFRVDWSVIRPVDFVVVIIAFLFVDLFDTLGTLIGVAAKANMLMRIPGTVSSAVMQAWRVAPVVATSSSSRTCVPFKDSGFVTWNIPSVFFQRSMRPL